MSDAKTEPVPVMSVTTQIPTAMNMVLRDYFAAKAMQAFLSQPPSITWGVPDATMAQDAYNVADAMMKAREGK